MIFQRSLMANGLRAMAMTRQWNDVRTMRENANRQELAFVRNGQLAANEGLIPQDVYQEFDNVTVERFRSDDGDTFLNDLIPASRSINIGKLTHKYRRASDSGIVQTSLTGQNGVQLDNTQFNYDGSIVPIHDAGFGRNWREWPAMRSEGFDALIDDQRETVAAVRRRLADNFLDGHTDKDGNLIAVDGLSWGGMRNDARVAQVDLGAGGVNFDFTDTAQTYAAIEAAFKQVRDVLWITNNCERDATYYVSREIASNFERNSSESYASEKIMNRLAQLMGVAAIKSSSKLSGNEMMAFPPGGNGVRPISGMALNTVAMPRPVYNSDYAFVTWAAIGFEVRTDFAGRKCALYASG